MHWIRKKFSAFLVLECEVKNTLFFAKLVAHSRDDFVNSYNQNGKVDVYSGCEEDVYKR